MGASEEDITRSAAIREIHIRAVRRWHNSPLRAGRRRRRGPAATGADEQVGTPAAAPAGRPGPRCAEPPPRPRPPAPEPPRRRGTDPAGGGRADGSGTTIALLRVRQVGAA